MNKPFFYSLKKKKQKYTLARTKKMNNYTSYPMLYERKFTGWIGYGLYEWRMAQKSFLFKVWFWPLGLCTFKFPFQWEMKEYINWLLLFHTNLLVYAIFHTPTLLAFFIAVMLEGDLGEPCTSLQHGQHRELEMRESSLQEFSFIDASRVCNTIISDAGTSACRNQDSLTPLAFATR